MDLLVQRFAAQITATKSGETVAAWRVREDQHSIHTPNPRRTAADDASIHTSSVTFAAIFEWIEAVRDAIVTPPANPDSPGRRHTCQQRPVVIGVALPPCSVEESALVLAVARERRWVYVPLDTAMPLDHQVAVLRDARVEALVTVSEATIAQFLAANARSLLEGPPRPVSSCAGFQSVVIFRLSSRETRASWAPESQGDESKDADAPLYVLYTSGSSGHPKGVVGTRAGALNRLEWMWHQFPFESGAASPECVARVTRLTFVDSVWEILGALLKQVPLVHLEPAGSTARRRSVVLDRTELFMQAAQALCVSRFTIVPSVLEVLLLQHRASTRLEGALASVRLVLVSGEVLPLRLVEQAARALPHAKLLNLYGSTEVSGDVTWMAIPAPLSASQLAHWRQFGVPIGSVRNRIGDTRLKLEVDGGASIALQPDFALSSTSPPQPSQEGELCVAGSALALGYVAREAVTSEFGVLSSAGGDVEARETWVVAENAGGGGGAQRWFRTGDSCKVVGDEIFYCGRLDSLVKIRGQRVQLEAAERVVQAALAELDAAWAGSDVRVAVLALDERHAAGLRSKSLVAFLLRATTDQRESDLPAPQPAATARTFSQKAPLLQWIKERYGDVYVPRDVVVVPADCVEWLPSGKLDRASLVALYASDGAGAGEKASGEEMPRSASRAARVVAALVAKLLGDTSSDVMQRTFQELGGNSLHAALLSWELQEELGCSVSAHELLSLTLLSVAESLEATLTEQSTRVSRQESHEDADSRAQATDSAGRKRTSRDAKRPKHCHPHSHAPMRRRSAVWALSRSNQTSAGDTCIPIVRCSTPAALLRVELAWQVDLRKCVDASPLLVHREVVVCTEAGATWAVIGSHAGTLVCMDAGDGGSLVWERTLDDRIEATAVLSEATRCVYVGTYSGALYAVDLATGSDKWVFRARDAIKAAVRVVDELRLVVCGAYDHTVYGIDALTGQSRWELSTDGGSVFATPAYLPATRQLVVATTKGDVYCVVLSAELERRAPPVRCWARQLPAPVFSSPTVSPATGLLLLGCADGVLYALDTASGDVRWQHATERPVFSTPCVYEHHGDAAWTLVGSHDCALRKVATRSGAVAWRTELGSPIFGSPAVFELVTGATNDESARRLCCVATVDGTLFVCDEASGDVVTQVSGVHCSGGDTVTTTLRQPLGELFSSPVVAGNLCLIGSRSNQLYAFQFV